MRIAYFTDTFYPEINGVTNTLNNLTAFLDREKIEYLIFAPDYDNGAAEETRSHIIRFKGIRPIIYPNCRLALPNHKKVKDAITAFNPDVIHITTELTIGMVGLRVARELSIPIVMSYHTNYDKYLKFYDYEHLRRPLWKYIKWFHSFAKINLCPSKATMAELEALGFNNLDIWSRGIDSGLFNPKNRRENLREQLGGKDKMIFLYVGRIAREKGLDTLAKAIRLFNKKYEDNAVFVFTGDGPFINELKEFNIPNAVFTGFKQKDELSQIYSSCDVFTFPSGTETFGNVVLEAMASGLPVICCNSGGITDFTFHLENAYVYNYKNVKGLAQAMTELMENSELRERLRDNALATAKLHGWNSIFDGLLSQYESVAKEPSEATSALTGMAI